MKNLLLIFLTLFGFIPCLATQIVEVTPLTYQVLLVHFDDGYVVHHQNLQPRANESVVAVPLLIGPATTLSTYQLISPADADYLTAKNPVDIGRKTKATEFTWLCQSYNNGCINTSPDAAREHWIYLFLPHPLKNGQSYTLTTGSLATHSNSFTFTYHDQKSRSEAVHVNQLGYRPDAPGKYGYFYHWMGDKGGLNLSTWAGKSFSLVRTSDDVVVFTGQVTFRKAFNAAETGQLNETPNQNFIGADVYECDFSAFQTPGEYRLSVADAGCSFPFRIAPDAYTEAFFAVMKGLYQQRSGIALTAPYTDQPRPAPHRPGVTPLFNNRLKYTSTRLHQLSNEDHSAADLPLIQAGISGPVNTWGWYQDAGDWDSYFTHGRVPVELLFLYEMAPAAFTDGQLNIPESGNGLPDLLDEAAWLIRFYHRTRHALMAAGYSSGGVGGSRVAGDWFGSDTGPNDVGLGSWQDTHRDWVVLGADAFLTYRYSGLAAHFAYLLRTHGLTDPEGVNWEQEARDAYTWAAANTLPADLTPKHSQNLVAMRLYAAASLYRLTGEASFQTRFVTDVDNARGSNNALIYAGSALNDDWAYPAFVYLLLPDSVSADPSVSNVLRNAVTATCNQLLLDHVDDRACRWGGNFFFPMLVGHGTTPMINLAVIGYAVAQTYQPAQLPLWRRHIFTTADYFLGNNPQNQVWITRVGDRSPTELFNLDWWYSGKTEVRMGLVPYGPWKEQDMGPLGPWNHNWAHQYVYPAIGQWPGHERWFSQRTSPLTCEYTIHQNLLPALVVYGALSADTLDFTLSADPESAPATFELMPNPVDNGQITVRFRSPNGGVLRLTSLTGQVLLEQEIAPGVEGYDVLVPQGTAKGMYLVQWQTEDGRETVKVWVR